MMYLLKTIKILSTLNDICWLSTELSNLVNSKPITHNHNYEKYFF